MYDSSIYGPDIFLFISVTQLDLRKAGDNVGENCARKPHTSILAVHIHCGVELKCQQEGRDLKVTQRETKGVEGVL